MCCGECAGGWRRHNRKHCTLGGHSCIREHQQYTEREQQKSLTEISRNTLVPGGKTRKSKHHSNENLSISRVDREAQGTPGFKVKALLKWPTSKLNPHFVIETEGSQGVDKLDVMLAQVWAGRLAEQKGKPEADPGIYSLEQARLTWAK